MMKKAVLLTPVLLATIALLNGCIPLAVGAAAGGAIGVAATQEGGIGSAASDALIQTQINDLWFRQDTEMFRKLDLTVDQGRVLITGVVQKPEQRVEAVRLAWKPKGVKQVINEIRVAQSEGIPGYLKDKWISARLRSEIILDRQIENLNYSIDTVQGAVYLMGVAQTEGELMRVIETARAIPGVRNVVSYVKLAGEIYNEPADLSGYAPNNTAPGAIPPAVYPEPYNAPPSYGQPVTLTPAPVEEQMLPP